MFLIIFCLILGVFIYYKIVTKNRKGHICVSASGKKCVSNINLLGYNTGNINDINNCKAMLDENFPDMKESFKEKICKVYTNKKILDKLKDETEYENGLNFQVYSNKLENLTDGIMIGFGLYLNNNNNEILLYTQIEPFLDEILAKY